MMNETLYFNGNIITMEERQTAEALLVQNGRIAAAGPLKEVAALAAPQVQRLNLKGKTMLPAFVDSHSHITSLATALLHCSLDSAANFQQLAALLKEHVKARGIQPGQWVVGLGYDHNFLKEQAHPTKELLDAAFPKNPVMIAHASGHMGVANSMALQAMGITKNTPDPSGGHIGRTAGEPNGYLEENAFIQNQKVISPPSREELLSAMEQAQDIYLRFGITLAQDGLTKEEQWQMLQNAALSNKLKIDIVAYADLKNCPNLLTQNLSYTSPLGRLSIGGYKIFLDGSPQGRTAWLTQPYTPGPEGDGYCGYPIYTNQEVTNLISQALTQRRQLLAHCNGDAASQQFIDAMEAAVKATGIAPLRPVMVHAQLVQPHQLGRMAALGIIPSFFVAHTYHWGDIHIKNLGKDRAAAISPAKTALEKGLPFTFHQDTPVIAPNMLETLWCAVTRQTKSGLPLGPGECISPYEALKAVTINGAKQYGQEQRRGSIKKGKLADLVILSHNPLALPPQELGSMEVLATIKEGDILWQSPAYKI